MENELVANKYLPFIQPSQTLTPVIGAGNFFQMSEHNYATMVKRQGNEISESNVAGAS